MSYSNTRYQRHTFKLTTPFQEFPKVQQIQAIQPIEAVQPVYPYQGLDEKRRAYTHAQQDQETKTFLSNYNDPTELNSYIDALTNREAVAKKFGDTWADISTTAGTVSLIADIASIVLTVVGWIVSAFVPGDFGAIGAAGQAAGTAIKAGAAASKGAKALSAINKATKVASTVSKIAAIPAIPAALDVTYEKGIKPILAGKPDEAGLNMLMNLGETMDRYANPIKGLILEGPEGFVKGTGLSKEGRVNYDYDTGFFLTDMLLEIVTDPINVLQVAGKIGQKTAIKATIKTTTQTLTDNIDNVIRTGAVNGFKSITEEGSQRMFKAVDKATSRVATEWAEASADGFMKQAKELAVKIKGKSFRLLSKTEQEEVIKIAKERLLKDGRDKIQRTLVQALHKEFPEATAEEIEILLKKSGKNFANNSALQSARQIIDNIELDTLSSQIVKSTSALVKVTNASDAWMVKGAMLTSGYGLGVELIKDGIKASKIWASNIALRSLKDAKAFNSVSGLDIKKYADAKKLWEASYNYVYEITSEKSVRDMATFQEFVNQQFSRDKQFITLVMQNTDAIKMAGQLEGQFSTLYQCTFKDYVGFIKGINDAENGAFNEYVKYLEHTLEVLGDHATRQGAGETIKTVQSLFNIKDMVPDNIVLKLQDAMKNTDSPIELVEKLYTIKMNDAYVNSILVNDPRISEVLMEINSSEKVGALLDKISGDLNALAPEVAAQIPVATRIIKEAGASFANIKELYTEIAGTNFTKVKGITDNDFRKYIIDQIFGLKTKSVIELLAEFDSITMPSLKNGLEVLLYDKGFKFADYPALEDQIAGIYKRFLEAQQAAGLREVNATIVQDFTKSIDDLIQYMPKYADELQELSIANIQIKTTLGFIRDRNFTLLESVFTTKETIFGILNQRQLTDAGLALKTVSIKQNLDLFDLPKEWSGNLIKSADRLGASLNHLMESLAQYNVMFNESVSASLKSAYMAFRKQFIDNSAYIEFEKYPAFQYLREATNPIEQFAQLVEFNKLAKDSTDSKIFKDILSKKLDTTTYLNVMNPSRLLITDFAWSPMAQSAWVAKTQFNEGMLNSINLYRNFDLSVQKGVADFRELQNTLSTHKLDRVKALQNERYIRTLSRYADSFDELKTYYDSLFDKDLAAQQIENVRKILISNPELNTKYSELIDTLEAYWRGEKEFIQSAKSDKTTLAAQTRWEIRNTRNKIERVSQATDVSEINKTFDLRRLHEDLDVAEARLKNLQAQGYDDEFTPFWWEIKEFNKAYVRAQQKTITEDFLREMLSEANYKYWFEQTTIGERLLDILTNPTIVDLTEDDYNIYIQFIQRYLKKHENTLNLFKFSNGIFSEAFNIPYNLLPASLKEIELKYYYDILEIDDPNIIYSHFINGTAGWYTPGTNDINAVLMHASRPWSFKELKRTLNHESGHNILRRVLGSETVDYTQFMQNFKTQFINTFGQTAYAEVEHGLTNRYRHIYAGRKNFTQDVFEEIFTFSLAGRLREFSLEALYAGKPSVLKDIPQYKIDDFAQNLTEQLRDIAQSKRTTLIDEARQTFEKYAKQQEVQLPRKQFNYLNPWDPVKKQQELNRLISKATDANAKGSLYNLFNQTPEEFINELAYRNRFITFSEADVADHKLNGMFNKFKNTLPETVYLHHDVKNHRYWIVLKDSKDLKLTQAGRQVYLNGNPISRLQNPKRFDEFIMVDEYIGSEGPKLTETLNRLNDDLYELTGTPLGDSQGEYLTREMLEDIYIQMPQEVKDALPKLEEWTDKQFFEACRFNESIIGSAASKRELGLYSTNQIINTRNALQSAVGYLKPKNEYINAVFNSSLSINSPNSIWAQFTDEELLEALQITDEYKLVALVNDPKYGVKTREIIPSSVDAIKKAKELGAVIIPQQTYKDMYNVVNHRLGSNGLMKLWSRIMYCYKFGYLLNPAAWIRNWIDTNLKSRFALGGEANEYQKRARNTLADIRDMSDAVSAAIDAQQNLAFKRAETEYLDLARGIFKDKDRIEKFIQRRSRDGIIREEEIKKWFADPNNKKRILTYESYKELRDNFLSQGISGNVMSDLYKGSGGDAWNTFTQLTGNIVEFGNKFENTHRLAQYLYELDHGETYTTALSKIAKTHFDYSFKTKAEQLAEMVFPFTTFSLRNASYWIEMIEKHPWIMRNYVHLMKPSWDFKDYTPAELARDRRAQAQILYGQIKLGEFNDKVLTFKANPSIQDALQMFSDPINNVYDKLAAPFAAIRDVAKGEEVNIMNTLPIAGPVIQNIQKTVQTGSPLPSLVGVNKKYQRFKSMKWSNPNLSGTDKYTDSTYRTPKYRKNVVYDAYTTKGITRYRTNFYPIIDIAHDIKMRYSTNVYNQIKNRVKTDVYQGVRYRIKLDANRFR